MRADEVNEMMTPEARAKLDEEKTAAHLRVKLNIFDVAFHNLEATSVESGDIIDETNFRWVPFPCGLFVDMLIEGYFLLGQDRSKKFIDVGCGIGTKVMLACVLFDAYGIDYNAAYVEKAKAFGLNRVGLADALEFDRYDNFDLLYYYRPIRDHELYRKFEMTVYEQMKPGALLAPMQSEVDWTALPNMEQVSRMLYRKK